MPNTIFILLTKLNYCLLQQYLSIPKYNFLSCVKRMSKTERCKCDPSVPELSSVRSQLAAVSSVAFLTQPYQPHLLYSKIILPLLRPPKRFKAEWKYFLSSASWFRKVHSSIGRFLVFANLSYLQEQHVDNNNNIYLLQLGCYPVAVVILHVNKHEIGFY